MNALREAGEVAQHLRARAAPAEDLSSVLRTHVRQLQSSVTPASEALTHLLVSTGTVLTCTNPQMDTYIHI